MPSSVIASLQYNVKTQTLRIRFVSGTVYEYKKVPQKIYFAMRAAGSKGSFLNNRIKGHYVFKKVS